MHIICSKPTI